jgi:hypothetical protein
MFRGNALVEFPQYLAVFEEVEKLDQRNLPNDERHEELDNILKGGERYLEILGEQRPRVRECLDLIRKTVIVNAWTSFETMAEDLWRAALNVHPRGLAELKGKPKSRITKRNKNRRKSDQPPIVGETRAGDSESDHSYKPMNSSEEDKHISLNALMRFEFDVKHRMGDVICFDGRFDFSVLESVRSAYSTAFHKSAGAIDDALSDTSFDCLNALRNVIVHCGGIADGKYVTHAKTLQDLPKAVEGEAILLENSTVWTLVCRVLAYSLELIRAVDDWVSSSAHSPP